MPPRGLASSGASCACAPGVRASGYLHDCVSTGMIDVEGEDLAS
jgi:hypothetical protein